MRRNEHVRFWVNDLTRDICPVASSVKISTWSPGCLIAIPRSIVYIPVRSCQEGVIPAKGTPLSTAPFEVKGGDSNNLPNTGWQTEVNLMSLPFL